MILPLEKICVSLKLAKKLKEVGFPQDSCWSWCKSVGMPHNMHQKDTWNIQLDVEENEPNASEIVAAPTASELMEVLPEYYHVSKCNQYNLWCCFSGNKDFDSKHSVDFLADTPSDALAKMYIYLKEKKLI